MTTWPFAGFVNAQLNVYGGCPPDADATNVHVTLPVGGATQGVFCTVNEPVSPGMLVVVVDEDAVDVVVPEEGPVDPPPQLAAARATTARTAAPECLCDVDPRVRDDALMLPCSSKGWFTNGP